MILVGALVSRHTSPVIRLFFLQNNLFYEICMRDYVASIAFWKRLKSSSIYRSNGIINISPFQE